MITKLDTLLNNLGACEEARQWAAGKTLAKAWRTCERADWMLWLAGTQADQPGWPTRKQLVLAACSCAATALKYVPKVENRPKDAIKTARLWVRGKATIEQVRGAAYAANAYAANAYAANAYATAYAAYAANAAANAYATATPAPFAATAAAYAAYVKARANTAASRAEALKKMAAIVRRQLKVPTKRFR